MTRPPMVEPMELATDDISCTIDDPADENQNQNPTDQSISSKIGEEATLGKILRNMNATPFIRPIVELEQLKEEELSREENLKQEATAREAEVTSLTTRTLTSYALEYLGYLVFIVVLVYLGALVDIPMYATIIVAILSIFEMSHTKRSSEMVSQMQASAASTEATEDH